MSSERRQTRRIGRNKRRNRNGNRQKVLVQTSLP